MRTAVKIEEKIAKAVFWSAGIIILGILFFIIFHILKEGLFAINWEFLTEAPREMGREGGIFPIIIGTIYVVALSIAVGAPIGIMAAVFLTEYAKKGKLVSTIRFFVETLAAIPSIVFGLFGFLFFVIYLGWGWSIMSGGLTLACMLLPIIIRTTEESIKAVPESYREGSLALGATRWQTVYKIVLPCALPGIITGVILGIGRAISEAAAVFLTAGMAGLIVPESVWDPARTLTVHLFILASEGICFERAYATAAILVIMILIINYAAHKLSGMTMRMTIKK
ncbi:phosphate ABC transporter permease PstA [Peptococcaceae bacterium]|nr:phosphate ABC transporter permease PstA [Peptococcaceae bacterium]